MSGRQSFNKQNSGRGAPNNDRAPNNCRGNDQSRPQSTPTTTSRSSNGHHTTTSTAAIVKNLLERSSNSSTSSSAQSPRVPASYGNITALSEQVRQQAEIAMKSVKESNRQAQIQQKTQADARTQAETLRLSQEADDNVLHENQNFPYAPDAYFNITTPDGFTFSKAMSPSFGGISHVMNVNELVKSPQLVLDSLFTTESMAHSNPIEPTNMDTESTKYFIMINSRRYSAVNHPCVPGELAWLKSSPNVRGYALYQDINHTTAYGRLT
jgi:hypothetical protein